MLNIQKLIDEAKLYKRMGFWKDGELAPRFELRYERFVLPLPAAP